MASVHRRVEVLKAWKLQLEAEKRNRSLRRGPRILK